MSFCETVLTHSKNIGFDESEAIFAKRKITTVRITDSEIAEVKRNHEESIGIRLIKNKKISSIQTGNFKEIPKLIDSVFELSQNSKSLPFWKSLPHEFKINQNIEQVFDKKLDNMSELEASDLAQQMINGAEHPKVTSITGSLNIVSEEIEIRNSNGLSCSDNATYISGTINSDSDFGTSPVSGIGQASGRTLEKFSLEKIGKEASEMCVNSINPTRCEEKKYSIIFDPYSVGELLAFVFAGNFNLKTFSEKKSCFSNSFGKKIAVDEFSLFDDPHAPDGIGSKIFDDEGVATTTRPLVKNGIFQNTYSDLFNAFKEKQESSGNASRAGSPMGRSSEPIPIPAPHNLRIKSNGISRDEIIKDTQNGLIVGRLWYTYPVNPIKGDFSCTARSGVRIIENGEISAPGKSVRIIHNLPILLQNISAIGDDARNVLQWASLPSITPSIKVDEIKVNPI